MLEIRTKNPQIMGEFGMIIGTSAVLGSIFDELSGARSPEINLEIHLEIHNQLAVLSTSPEGGDIALHGRAAGFEALNLILGQNPPAQFVGTPQYSTYARFHRLATDYVSNNASDDATQQLERTSLPDASGPATAFASGTPRRMAEDLTLAELALAPDIKTLPEPFREAFKGGENTPGWFSAYTLYLAWRISSNQPYCQALMAALGPVFQDAGIGEQNFLDHFFAKAKSIASEFDTADNLPDAAERSVLKAKEIVAYVTERLPEDYPPPAWMLPGLHQRQNIPLDVLVMLMEAVKRQKQPKHSIVPALKEKVEIYQNLINVLNCADGSSIWQAAALCALSDARLDDAELYLQQADPEGSNIELQMISGDLQYLGSYFLRAVRHYEKAASRLTADNATEMRAALLAIARALIGHERASGEDKSFNMAIEVYQRALRLAQEPDDRLRQLAEIGRHLLDFGRRAKGTDRLNEAIGVFGHALNICRSDDDPDQWAELHHQLGITHMVIGNRDKSTGHWSAAATHFRETLTVRTREKAAPQWATVQFQLGHVQRSIGEQEKDHTFLQAAIDAYQNALLERSREKQPGPWSDATIWLAKSQYLIGEITDDMASLQSAIVNFDRALEFVKPQAQFGLWLEAQLGLARTNRNIIRLNADPDLLNKTEANLAEALETARPKAVPWQLRLIEKELAQLRAM